MKYVVLIGDGMGDYPMEELGGRTPLQAASTPAMDFLAREGELGLVETVPPGFEPGSDVANLSILGYDPASCYTGRGPLEAGSMGITLSPDDVAFRCNLVTLDFMADGQVVMVDYSAGHISTEEARAIVADIRREVKVNGLTLYPGVSYRHLLVWAEGKEKLATVPPHDYTGKDVTAHWGVYEHDPDLINWIAQVLIILRDHPVNERRVKEGKKPANAVWLWGQGRMPYMPKFAERFGIKGAIISAVDLLKGIGVYAGLEPIAVPGATGYLDTNYQGKAEYALAALKEKDLVVVHVEAPDEASHGGNLEEKIKAIENFDQKVVQVVVDGLAEFGEHRVLLVTDHYTPISIKTHVGEPVPFVIFSSNRRGRTREAGFNEVSAKETGLFIREGFKLMERFIRI
ncbi:MAG: cofactor-independent phosphoglycerate mutase [Thermodesulfobacteriota bacterium]|nr:cofactor-independent phosphoglycerate mutase [Thermodesulfobacteriota bacterium]